MTRPFNATSKQTPWGHADYAKELAPGIWELSTPGHGGFYLDAEARRKVPAPWIKYGAEWSHGWGAGWFEEDCAALAVLLTFPELFPDIDADMWERIKASAAKTLPAAGATQAELVL